MEKLLIISIIVNIILVIYYRKKMKKAKSDQQEAYQNGGLRAIDALLSHQKCYLCEKEFEIDKNQPLEEILRNILKNSHGHYHLSCGLDPM